MATSSYTPPGRLGNPDMNVITDPRTNPKIAQQLKALGMADSVRPELPEQFSIEALTPLIRATHDGITSL